MVVSVINMTPEKQQPEANPVMGLLSQIIMAGAQEEPEPEETGSKKKK